MKVLKIKTRIPFATIDLHLTYDEFLYLTCVLGTSHYNNTIPFAEENFNHRPNLSRANVHDLYHSMKNIALDKGEYQ